METNYSKRGGVQIQIHILVVLLIYDYYMFKFIVIYKYY